ncbi:MAG: hypothetical protein GWO02_05660, partial [Gammaproteobacteria bacterium]|nr:hypothetical protein [Gammaproteobacteria bacterium]
MLKANDNQRFGGVGIMSMKRRTFLKGSLAVSAVGVAV